MNKNNYDDYKKSLKEESSTGDFSTEIKLGDRELQDIKLIKEYSEWNKDTLFNNLLLRAIKEKPEKFKKYIDKYNASNSGKIVSFDLSLGNAKLIKQKGPDLKKYCHSDNVEQSLIIYGIYLYKTFFELENDNE
ncbi:TPA: hypothetical protein NGS96_002745 [Vibrio parahaemolyticus]|nr:hypothetical protein [Vibrio parahaemolyticus]